MECCICAVAKNENAYINDWVEYHVNLGFSHISIYDNNAPNTKYVGDCISDEYRKYVEIIPANTLTHGFQVKCYTDFYTKNYNKYDWIAFLDIDEYMCLVKHNIISDFLNTIKPTMPVVRLNWQLYGDDGIYSGDVSIPVNKRIVKKLKHPLNTHGKCIVRGGLAGVEFTSSHYPLINGEIGLACMPSGKDLGHRAKLCLPIEYSVAYIAHYMTKTWVEFKQQKMCRTDAGFDRTLSIEYFRRLNPKSKLREKINLIGNCCITSHLARKYGFDNTNPFTWVTLDFNSFYYLITNYANINWGNFTLRRKKHPKYNNYVFDVIVDNHVAIRYFHFLYDPTYRVPKVSDSEVKYCKIWEYIVKKYIEHVRFMIAQNEPPCFVCEWEILDYNKENFLKLYNTDLKYKCIVITNDASLRDLHKSNLTIVYDPSKKDPSSKKTPPNCKRPSYFANKYATDILRIIG